MTSDLPREWLDSLGRIGPDHDPDATLVMAAEPSQAGPGTATGDIATLATGRLFAAQPVTSTHDAEFQRRFRPRDTIGRGGMGDVLSAEQLSLAREVAIKVVHGGVASDAQAETFRNEARITASLNHPNVVTVHDAGEDFLVMKRVRGRTLQEQLDRDGNGPERLPGLVEALIKVCDAVAYAHQRLVLHRDLKLANIMVGAFGEVVLMDWGLAVPLEPGPDGRLRARFPSREHVAAGTPSCLPPECAHGHVERIGPAADLFMLGACLYRILCRRSPFSAPDPHRSLRLAAGNTYKPVAEWNPQAPTRLIAVHRQAMASEPHERGTLGGFAEGLRGWLRARGNEDEAARSERRGRELLAIARACAARRGASTAADAPVPAPATPSGLPLGSAAPAGAQGADGPPPDAPRSSVHPPDAHPLNAYPLNAYRAHAEALASFDHALGLWPDHAAAVEGAREAVTGHVRTALAAGDLLLADSLIETAAGRSGMDASTLAALRGEWRGAEQRRQRRAALRRVQRAGALILALLFIGAAAGFLWYGLHSDRRAVEARRLEAQRLVDEARTIAVTAPHAAVDPARASPADPATAPSPAVPRPADDPRLIAWQRRQSMARRALGLDPSSGAAAALLVADAAAATRWALETGVLDLAQALLDAVADLPEGAALARALGPAVAERQVAMAQERQRHRAAWRAELRGVVGEHTVIAAGGAERAAATLARWGGDDGELAAMLDGMVAEGDPVHRAIACRVYGRRPDLGADATLIGLLADHEPTVVEAAWTALAIRRHGESFPAMLAWLRQRGDPDQTRRLGAQLGAWGAEMLARGGGEPALRDLLAVGDDRGFCARARAAALPADRILGARILLHRHDQPEGALAVLAPLSARDDAATEVVVTAAAALRRIGRVAEARAQVRRVRHRSDGHLALAQAMRSCLDGHPADADGAAAVRDVPGAVAAAHEAIGLIAGDASGGVEVWNDRASELADALHAVGLAADSPGMVATAQRLMAAASNRWTGLAMAAERRYRAGDTAVALAWYGLLAERFPGLVDPLRALRRIALASGDEATAEALAERIAWLRPWETGGD